MIDSLSAAIVTALRCEWVMVGQGMYGRYA